MCVYVYVCACLWVGVNVGQDGRHCTCRVVSTILHKGRQYDMIHRHDLSTRFIARVRHGCTTFQIIILLGLKKKTSRIHVLPTRRV